MMTMQVNNNPCMLWEWDCQCRFSRNRHWRTDVYWVYMEQVGESLSLAAIFYFSFTYFFFMYSCIILVNFSFSKTYFLHAWINSDNHVCRFLLDPLILELHAVIWWPFFLGTWLGGTYLIKRKRIGNAVMKEPLQCRITKTTKQVVNDRERTNKTTKEKRKEKKRRALPA